MLATLGVGVGGILSQLASGWLLDHGGSRALYLGAGLGCLLLAALLPFVLPAPRAPD
jgi:hypothetical protein